MVVVMEGRREVLETLQRQLQSACYEATTRELPALARELRQVVAELDELPGLESTAPADEIARRREARRKASGE